MNTLQLMTIIATLDSSTNNAISALNHASEPNPLNPIWAVLAIILLLPLFAFIFPSIKSVLFNKLHWWALGVWILGFILYSVGFNEDGSANFMTLALRASISSLEMFASHSDLLEVKDQCHINKLYMLLFAITHFMAVVISAAFIVRVIGIRLISKISILRKWIFIRYFKSNETNGEDLYVFWGVNHNSILVANSIKPNDGRKHCIIFINLLGEHCANTYSSRSPLSLLFNTSDDDVKKYIGAIDNMGAILLNAKRDFAKESFKDLNGDNVSIFNSLGISFCDEYIDILLQDGKNRVQYFFLSDNEEANINAIITLNDIYNKAEKKPNIKCYCHARSNRMNSTIIDSPGLTGQIYLIDSSSLAVLSLKHDVDSHPVNFIDIDSKTCLAKSPFTAMVIGFGEAGRDAFRFLYEFASIPQNDLGEENPKTIYVVDEHLSSIKEDFLIDAPALANEKKSHWWIDSSTHSKHFWDNLKSTINALNYIVITVGSDDEAMNLAIDLFEFAYRYRDNMHHFRIYVRVRNSERYCNLERLYDSYILPFGSDESTFSYNNISEDVAELGAKKFYYAYKKVRLEGYEAGRKIDFNDETVKKEVDKNWTDRRSNLVSPNNDLITRKYNLIQLHYQEIQDMSNYYHIKTKRYLADWEKGGQLSPIQCSNLANCEHLRWNAKIELLGFVSDISNTTNEQLCSTKDMRKRIHSCLVDCQTLKNGPNKDSEKYDRIAVKVSFISEFDN